MTESKNNDLSLHKNKRMIVERFLEHKILKALKLNKVMMILGPRRIGKTVLLKKIAETFDKKTLFLNGDDIQTSNLLAIRSEENYRKLLGGIQLLIIDEAQEISEIGHKLKLIVDTIEGIYVMVTGSSAFELNNQLGEPLVGRVSIFNMYPIAQIEFSKTENYLETHALLEHRLIYGSYPELLHIESKLEKEKYLKELVYSYLLKDILAFEGIKKRDKILSLLQIMAYRVGSEISLEGIGNELQISKNTVEKYLDLFSKVFIMYPVSGYSRNADNEITKKKKWYFIDNGIRNAIIQQFAPTTMREDIGKLWENYLNAERIKKMDYQDHQVLSYFWRTKSHQEIDRLEEKDGKLTAYEYKWTETKAKIPPQFAKNYPDAIFNVIHRENYLDYIL
jgi:predicted AAA+ superfamily ATPase